MRKSRFVPSLAVVIPTSLSTGSILGNAGCRSKGLNGGVVAVTGDDMGAAVINSAARAGVGDRVGAGVDAWLPVGIGVFRTSSDEIMLGVDVSGAIAASGVEATGLALAATTIAAGLAAISGAGLS